jgi:hypothetical protein
LPEPLLDSIKAISMRHTDRWLEANRERNPLARGSEEDDGSPCKPEPRFDCHASLPFIRAIMNEHHRRSVEAQTPSLAAQMSFELGLEFTERRASDMRPHRLTKAGGLGRAKSSPDTFGTGSSGHVFADVARLGAAAADIAIRV